MALKTLLLDAYSKKDCDMALSLLKKGELVAVPTETVYGLAADAKNPEAVKKIFIAKNRPQNHPLIVHIASISQLGEWACDISPQAIFLAEKFWPGPLTLLFKKVNAVFPCVTGGLDTIAVRVPQNVFLLDLLTNLNSGLAAPSANLHKKISPTTAQHVLAGLSGKIAAVLDGGACSLGLESTIVDVTGLKPKILRPGPISKKMIEDLLQMSIEEPLEHGEKVAGNMQAHYQPKARASIMAFQDIKNYVLSSEHKAKTFGLMLYSDLETTFHHKLVKMPSNSLEYARELYNALHELDSFAVDQILIETPPQTAGWSAVWDRLNKATYKK